MGTRDDFSKKTKDQLAKRVGFMCSSPTCRKHTAGPSTQIDKVSVIGKAAHVTAAAVGGPRYKTQLTPAERKHISNGIWLCSNCADLVDKDDIGYPELVLLKWKSDAEQEMTAHLQNGTSTEQYSWPFIEADLEWIGGGRTPLQTSLKNPIEFHEGRPVIIVGHEPIIIWEMRWNYELVLLNNSKAAAYNIKIDYLSEKTFATLSKLRPKNNLPPFDKVKLVANYKHVLEGKWFEADQHVHAKIPEFLEGLQFRITYHDDNRNCHYSTVTIINQEIVTTHN